MIDGDSGGAGGAGGEPRPAARVRGPMDAFLQPVVKRRRVPCAPTLAPQAALRATNLAQQLLAHELGRGPAASARAWREAQQRDGLTQLMLPPVWEYSGGGGDGGGGARQRQRQEVCCLELQEHRGADAALAAVGYACGMLHVTRLRELRGAAHRAELADVQQQQRHHRQNLRVGGEDAAAGALQQQRAREAPLPRGAVATFDLQDRLTSCAWARQGDGGELATAGGEGVKVRRLAEGGRTHEHALRLRSGGRVDRPGQVRYLDAGAAYQLAAARPAGVLLWDCRAASRAVAELPTLRPTQLLAPLPGGELLLAATPDGAMALYDVRRCSSSSSSNGGSSGGGGGAGGGVVNFGASRAGQQLVASYNVAARAEEAAVAELAAAAGGSVLPSGGGGGTAGAGAPTATAALDAARFAASVASNGLGSTAAATTTTAAAAFAAAANAMGAPLSSSSPSPSFRTPIYPYFRDVALNPVDPNLVGFVRPDLQVGVFDLLRNRVAAHAGVSELLPGAAPVVVVGAPRQAAARGVWDASGRVLFTHGLLQRQAPDAGVGAGSAGAGVVALLQPTLAAVDFGSAAGRRARRDATLAPRSFQQQTGEDAGVARGVESSSSNHQRRDGEDEPGVGGGGGGGGGRVVARGGQVVHLPLPAALGPTELAVAAGHGGGGLRGELLVGTLLGDVLWLD